MGIYDREYYREQTAGSLWLTGRTPATVGIIAVNVVAFVALQLSTLADLFALNPSQVFADLELWRLITATLCHWGLWGLIVHMVFLWWFGRELEMLYGTREFVVFYIEATLLSSLAWAAAALARAPDAELTSGAAGPVAAVVVLYAIYNPRHPINLYGIVSVQLRWLVLLYFGLITLEAVQDFEYSPIAHVPHLAGAVFGALFKWGDLRLGRLFGGFVSARRRPAMHVVRSQAKPEPAAAALDERLEHQMDRVLEKISREGKASLTDQEQAILEQAAQRLRDRRV